MKDGLGVARQEKECREWAERNGWEIAEVYVDNDISAYSGKRRPEFLRMQADVRAGLRDGILAWHTSRLTRNVRELEGLIDLHDSTGVFLATLNGPVDLASGQGRAMVRIFAALDQMFSDEAGDKLKAKHRELAEEGKHPGHARVFGYDVVSEPHPTKPDQVVNHRVVNEAEAAVLRTAFERTARQGEKVNLTALCREFNAAGHRTVAGREIIPQTLRSWLLSPMYAGLREHDEKFYEARWPAIVDRDTFRIVQDRLRASARRTNQGAVRKHLLSNLLRCECGGVMQYGASGKDDRRWERYACKGSGCYATIGKEVAETTVLKRVAALLAGASPVVRNFLDDVSEEVRAMRLELATLMDEVARINASPLDWSIKEGSLLPLQERKQRLEADIAAHIRRDGMRALLLDLAPLLPQKASGEPVEGGVFDTQLKRREEIRERLEAVELGQRREVIRALLNIDVAKARKGKTQRRDAVARIGMTPLDPATGEPYDWTDDEDAA